MQITSNGELLKHTSVTSASLVINERIDFRGSTTVADMEIR